MSSLNATVTLLQYGGQDKPHDARQWSSGRIFLPILIVSGELQDHRYG